MIALLLQPNPTVPFHDRLQGEHHSVESPAKRKEGGLKKTHVGGATELFDQQGVFPILHESVRLFVNARQTDKHAQCGDPAKHEARCERKKHKRHVHGGAPS
jgi:hypothetical protein